MSIVTAVPFGLAIRDQAGRTAPDPSADDAEAGAVTLRELVRDQLADQRTMLREAAFSRALDALYGPTPATPGTALAGLVLGTPVGEGAIDTARATTARFGLEVERSHDHLAGIELTIGDDEIDAGMIMRSDCTTLRERLEAAWGMPAHQDLWLDPTTHHRATISGPECTFRFDEYAEVEDWLAHVHPELAGGTVDAALDALGPAEETHEGRLLWRLPGLGAGVGATRLELATANEHVQFVGVTATATEEDVTALRDALATRLHAKPDEADGSTYTHVWSWRVKPRVHMEYDGANLVLEIGTPP